MMDNEKAKFNVNLFGDDIPSLHIFEGQKDLGGWYNPYTNAMFVNKTFYGKKNNSYNSFLPIEVIDHELGHALQSRKGVSDTWTDPTESGSIPYVFDKSARPHLISPIDHYGAMNYFSPINYNNDERQADAYGLGLDRLYEGYQSGLTLEEYLIKKMAEQEQYLKDIPYMPPYTATERLYTKENGKSIPLDVPTKEYEEMARITNGYLDAATPVYTYNALTTEPPGLLQKILSTLTDALMPSSYVEGLANKLGLKNNNSNSALVRANLPHLTPEEYNNILDFVTTGKQINKPKEIPLNKKKK